MEKIPKTVKETFRVYVTFQYVLISQVLKFPHRGISALGGSFLRYSAKYYLLLDTELGFSIS